MSTSFRAWLTEGQYVFYGTGSSGEILFYSAALETLMSSVAHDINRMGMAAFESIHGIPSQQDIPRSTAWTLIRGYYAAFFAAHAIARIFGAWASQMDKEQTTELNKAMRLAGKEPRIQQGLHRVELDPLKKCFSVCPLNKRPHEATWKEFGILVQRLTQDLLKDHGHLVDQDAQEAAVILFEILDVMKTPPCRNEYNWLSLVRNELNYQHRHGAWYPHLRVSRFREKVINYIAGWKRSPLEMLTAEEHTLIRFSKGCALIVSLMREILQDLNRRNPNNDSFLRHGAMRVLGQTATPLP
ncbi:MAG: hypothetical protein ABSC55_12620 [Syntrophorhabdales bacterium]